MKILYDHQIFTNQNYGGISRYFFELIKHFVDDEDCDVDVSLKFSNNAYLNEETFKNISPFFRGKDFRQKNRIHNYLNKTISKKKISENNFDIFHPTYYDPYFLKYISNKPFVVTFFDMIHEKLSNKFRELKIDDKIYFNKKILLENSTKIIAISQSTKNDIIEIFNIDPKKISVVYLGNSVYTNEGNGLSNFEKPYMLFVGNRNLYKNFLFLINSISDILIKEDIILICAGGGSFSSEEIQQIKTLEIEHKVFQMPIENDVILGKLYQNAEFFVFPSLYEGFGIPILEAFSCECPCLLSNVSSLPEIAGDAALYFNPYDANSIHSSVKQLLFDSNKKNMLKKTGKDRLKLFSWNNTYIETKNIYTSILK